ncbi:YheC/YheD family protein [Paenibacillus sp. PAMC21692]|uniref:YheC/YheD family protein n=1 Tax=Paenibacillus sp. PAMC21692 TaxID=2762320 RepID=UPI00164E56D7|nr:YheC/YheD family protein [Paenibacillus sp. PAMC21692]QNK56853.1 YheC/YheD family protein [Paenibacillus sp. PAMC21692]
MKYRSNTYKSKWVKTKWLMGSGKIRAYVPATKPFSRNNLQEMMGRFATVYCKPTSGSGGAGIMRVKKKNGGYLLQHATGQSRLGSMDSLYARMKSRIGGRSYLLQKGISLAKSNGRPFDTRVMVQKTNQGKWVSTALFTKIGRPGKVATNYKQGGSIGYFRHTMAGAGFGAGRISSKETELKRLGRQVGGVFDRRGKGFRELGLDVAMDGDGRVWILEVNTSPQFYPLKNMKDKSLYRRIMSYAKQYGRKG